MPFWLIAGLIGLLFKDKIAQAVAPRSYPEAAPPPQAIAPGAPDTAIMAASISAAPVAVPYPVYAAAPSVPEAVLTPPRIVPPVAAAPNPGGVANVTSSTLTIRANEQIGCCNDIGSWIVKGTPVGVTPCPPGQVRARGPVCTQTPCLKAPSPNHVLAQSIGRCVAAPKQSTAPVNIRVGPDESGGISRMNWLPPGSTVEIAPCPAGKYRQRYPVALIAMHQPGPDWVADPRPGVGKCVVPNCPPGTVFGRNEYNTGPACVPSHPCPAGFDRGAGQQTKQSLTVLRCKKP